MWALCGADENILMANINATYDEAIGRALQLVFRLTF
jgi:hypothetical protein